MIVWSKWGGSRGIAGGEATGGRGAEPPAQERAMDGLRAGRLMPSARAGIASNQRGQSQLILVLTVLRDARDIPAGVLFRAHQTRERPAGLGLLPVASRGCCRSSFFTYIREQAVGCGLGCGAAGFAALACSPLSNRVKKLNFWR